MTTSLHDFCGYVPPSRSLEAGIAEWETARALTYGLPYIAETLNPQSRERIMPKNLDDEFEKQRLDRELDKELEDTFPASDALKITRRQPARPKKSKRSDASER